MTNSDRERRREIRKEEGGVPNVFPLPFMENMRSKNTKQPYTDTLRTHTVSDNARTVQAVEETGVKLAPLSTFTPENTLH